MSDAIKDSTLLGVKKETTEGVWAEPASGDYIECNGDGSKIERTRDTKDRSLISGDRFVNDFRLGLTNGQASIPVEFKAGSAVGTAPEYQPFLESFGFKNQGLAAQVTSTADHTTTKIYISSGDVSKFKVNDPIKLLIAGGHNYNIVKSIGNDGADYLELSFALGAAPADGVVLEKSQVLKLDATQNVTLSISELLEGGHIQNQLLGGRTQKIDVSNFTTGEFAAWLFTVIGLNAKEKNNVSPLSITPAYDSSLPPLIAGACAKINGTVTEIDNFECSYEQTVAFKTSFCAENGKLSSRGTGKYKVTGKFSPYQAQDVIGIQLDETVFDLFVYAYNPASVDGESKEAIVLYFPACKATAVAKADKDGFITREVTWQLTPANKDQGPVIGLF